MVAVPEEFDRGFEQSYRAYEPILRRRSRRWLPPDEIDDAIQETFLRAWAHHHGRDPGIPWLLTVLRNLAIDRARRRRPEPVGDIELLDTPHEDGPEQNVIALDERRAVRDAIRQLTESQKRALHLREWEGLSHQEIAESLGTTIPSVESLLMRGRRRMRGMLEKVMGVAMWPAAGLWRKLRNLPTETAANAGGAAAPVAVSALTHTVANLATAAAVLVAGAGGGGLLGGDRPGGEGFAISSTSSGGSGGSASGTQETRYLSQPSGGTTATATSGGAVTGTTTQEPSGTSGGKVTTGTDDGSASLDGSTDTTTAPEGPGVDPISDTDPSGGDPEQPGNEEPSGGGEPEVPESGVETPEINVGT